MTLTANVLRERRLTPLEIVRASVVILRDRWLALLVVAVACAGVYWALAAVSNPIASRSTVTWRWILVEGAIWLQYVASGLRWMAIAAIVALATGESPVVSIALRRPWRLLWRWLRLSVLLMIVEVGGDVVATSAPMLLPWNSIDHGYIGPKPWLLGSTLYNSIAWLLSWVMGALLAYVNFAPLSLFLEDAPVGSAIAVSWSRVRGNWRWICITTVALWIPIGLLKIGFHFLPPGPVAKAASVILSMARNAILVGVSLAYVNLMLRGQRLAAAMAIEPASSYRPLWERTVPTVGDR